MRFLSKLVALAAVVGAFSLGSAAEISPSDKLYVSPENISLTKEGIFVFVMGEYRPVNALFSDSQGLYIQLSALANNERFSCPLGHPAPNGQGWCNHPDCPHWIGNK